MQPDLDLRDFVAGSVQFLEGGTLEIGEVGDGPNLVVGDFQLSQRHQRRQGGQLHIESPLLQLILSLNTHNESDLEDFDVTFPQCSPESYITQLAHCSLLL